MKIIPNKAERPTLHHILMAWVLILILIAIVAGAQTFFGAKKIQHQIKTGVEKMNLPIASGSQCSANLSNIDVSLERIKRQAAVSLVFFLMAAVFGFYTVNKRTVIPLNKIISGLETIQDGNLDVTMNTGGCREVEKIESLINEISSNFQEILLLVWTHSDKSVASCHRITEVIRQLPNIDMELLTDVASIHQRLREMRSLVSEFEFYDVTLNEDKVLAG
jgi:methyl-accepting chemotaxis protein